MDVFLVNVIAALLMAPLIWSFGPETYRVSTTPIKVTKCQVLDEIGGDLGRMLAAPTLQELQRCHESAIVFSNGHSLTATYFEEGDRVRRSLEIPVRLVEETSIEAVEPTSVDGALSVALLVVLSAAFLGFRGGRTPGKALLGLRVNTSTPAMALRREGLKSMPLLVLSLLWALAMIVSAFANMVFTVSQPFALGMGAGLFLFLLWTYILPLFQGDRRARWDRAVGTHVERDRR